MRFQENIDEVPIRAADSSGPAWRFWSGFSKGVGYHSQLSEIVEDQLLQVLFKYETIWVKSVSTSSGRGNLSSNFLNLSGTLRDCFRFKSKKIYKKSVTSMRVHTLSLVKVDPTIMV
jgi:hypothetical protein